MAHPQPVPWGAAIGPLALGNQLHDLPTGSRKHLPKFSGDGKVTAEDHISAFFTACAILGVQYEDVSVRIFVETLIDAAAEWFNQLPSGSITNWATLLQKFEERFKTIDDGHLLLAQLTQMKKEVHEPMREFVARFNKIVNKLAADKRPTEENQKCFFINAQPPDISFQIRRG